MQVQRGVSVDGWQFSFERGQRVMIFEENRETLGKIATLYYLGELSQEDIAEMYGISRFKVSRILKKCREYHIVEFHINNKPE